MLISTFSLFHALILFCETDVPLFTFVLFFSLAMVRRNIRLVQLVVGNFLKC